MTISLRSCRRWFSGGQQIIQWIPYPLRGLLLGLLIWSALTSAWINPDPVWQAFAPESAIAALGKLLFNGTLWPHIGASLQRIAVGLLAAIAVGVPVGLLFGLVPTIERSATGALQFIRMISPLSWMPIAVMAFGIGDLPVYFLLAIAAVWPILLSTSSGTAAVNQKFLLLARSLCATRSETIRRVVIPAIVPQILVGLRLAIGTIWIVLVPAEMLGVSSGLGYFILDTRDRIAYDELTAVLLAIGLIGCALDWSLQSLQKRWQLN
ncbi:ABC transporter permease [Synechococcus elongatus]|uniref:ABC transporter permease n=1 Tax=Synechococcus elongatus PCC 11802 TaxID=2283154 RepID=A0AAT9JUR4_SYNEL|nr:ABC transporter permease [Synechococcus elongatus]